ncbi:MAG: type I DNA topoisomerase [Acidobacteria bacterium]|nr:type I DNA topoisomerase [Acidobacteriota bacterium]
MAKSSQSQALVIVESPTKARTIEKFLGKGYTVKASNGHIRDLPTSQSEVPKEYKKAPWKDLGVDVDRDFWPLYVIPESKRQNVKDLKQLVKGADEIYLATDEDREGESISWHLLETLKPTVPVKRMVFHEITKDAIRKALESPREIDMDLVEAQETRRIVDRLYGYRVSPLLWKKMARGLSAGRVQSVAVRLLVERERERIRFQKAEFWGLRAQFAKLTGDDTVFDAELTHVGETRVATGRDFDPDTGKLKSPDAVLALDEAQARELHAEVLKASAAVESVDETPFNRAPAPPYVTSTLQQDANRKLRLAARRTMQVAQQLYENGYITYMRTDSTTLSDEALSAARRYVSTQYGAEYLPEQARQYRTKVKNAQEAHEAIRPAGDSFTPPEQVRQALGAEAGKLYELIFRRTLASQMLDARGTNIAVTVRGGRALFRATGKTVEFAGFLRAYAAGDDLESELGGQEKMLPKVAVAESLATRDAEALERATQAPPRFTEGSLIRELERLGIGRPSTWASIVDLVLQRSYAFKKASALVPTFTAMAVVGLLEEHFQHLCDYAFTAKLEDDLDAISRGEADRNSYLRGFYFGDNGDGLNELVARGEISIDPRQVCGVPLGLTREGQPVEVRIGRYGPFLASGETRASLAEDMPPDELTVDAALDLLDKAAKGPESLGVDPESGLPVYLKNGRFGPYVQLGDGSDDEKPKMASLLAGMEPEGVDLALALRLLALPRQIGPHPDDGKPVVAANGRFGPYVKWGDEIRSIPSDGPSPLDIGLERAVELLKQPKGRRQAQKATALRELGVHPDTGKALKILSGRYGPYVTDGEINASLAKGQTPESLTIPEATELLAARAQRLAEGGGRFGRKKVAKKKAAKKAGKRAKKAAKKKMSESAK